MQNKEKATGYIIPHTHWDREWRYPIWKSRMLLLEFVDQLLGVMENNSEYKYFMMDGQSIIIQDYLEVRPENRERVPKSLVFLQPFCKQRLMVEVCLKKIVCLL